MTWEWSIWIWKQPYMPAMLLCAVPVALLTCLSRIGSYCWAYVGSRLEIFFQVYQYISLLVCGRLMVYFSNQSTSSSDILCLEGFNKLGAWAGYQINVDDSVGVHVFVLCDTHNRLCPGLYWQSVYELCLKMIVNWKCKQESSASLECVWILY